MVTHAIAQSKQFRLSTRKGLFNAWPNKPNGVITGAGLNRRYCLAAGRDAIHRGTRGETKALLIRYPFPTELYRFGQKNPVRKCH